MLARSFLNSGISVCTLETKDFLTNAALIFLLCRSTKLNAVARWKMMQTDLLSVDEDINRPAQLTNTGSDGETPMPGNIFRIST